MKVGLFFGSFDPPHIGHINLVTSALNADLVDHIIVVPAYQNSWKSYSTPYSIRFEMCKYAFNLPKVSVSDIELELSDNNLSVPTYKVLQAFTEKWKNIDDREFCIITTIETLFDIPKWNNGQYILDNYQIFVNEQDFEAPYIEIHSSDVRDLIRNRKIVFPFITSQVMQVINKHNLYL